MCWRRCVAQDQTAGRHGAARRVEPAADGGRAGLLPHWERMAERAEAEIAEPQHLDRPAGGDPRRSWPKWRAALLDAQNANSARIATVREQIEALGPAPAEGADRGRGNLASGGRNWRASWSRLQAPGIAAEEAYRRADGLIREIDRILRERQADELLQLWPSPAEPGELARSGDRLCRTRCSGCGTRLPTAWERPEGARRACRQPAADPRAAGRGGWRWWSMSGAGSSGLPSGCSRARRSGARNFWALLASLGQDRSCRRWAWWRCPRRSLASGMLGDVGTLIARGLALRWAS